MSQDKGWSIYDARFPDLSHWSVLVVSVNRRYLVVSYSNPESIVEKSSFSNIVRDRLQVERDGDFTGGGML